MEYHTRALRYIILCMVCSVIGLASGMILGVRLAVNSIRSDIYYLRQDLKVLEDKSQPECLPILPPFNSDLEPEPKNKPEEKHNLPL